MPFQCTKRPSEVEEIIGSLALKQPEVPGRAVASSPSSWSRESKSFSNAERDSEMSASWRSVAKLHGPSHDRLRESVDWNGSNPRKVVAAPDEVTSDVDSSSVLVADA
jgi:hypothetical protein